MPFAKAGLGAFLLLAISLASGMEEGSDLLTELSSADPGARAKAAQNLSAERIGSLDPDLAVEAILLSLQDKDPRIREVALGGLGLLTAALADDTNPRVAELARTLHSSADLRPALEKALADDASVEVAVAASVPLMALYGKDPTAKALLLDRADREADPTDRIRLMGNLQIGGLEPATRDRLAQYLNDPATIVQLKAAHLILAGKTPPAARLDDFLRIVETDEAFADPKILKALPRFGVAPERYLPRLLVLQARLDAELAKPRDERRLAIYNDGYWKEILATAIADARKSQSPGKS